MKALVVSSTLIATFLLCGCYTSSGSPDYAKQANHALSAVEKDPKQGAVTDEQKEIMIRLWADKPPYVASIRDERIFKKMPRLVSSAVPAYPLMQLLAHVKATVVVSFIINPTGVVEAARVMESSDARFEQSAIDAVLKWKFLPAEFDDGPTIAVTAVPIVFDGMK